VFPNLDSITIYDFPEGLLAAASSMSNVWVVTTAD
jgi:hypothetical protein